MRLYFYLLLFFAFAAKAQQPYMWHITDEDGLPSMEVYNMLQDSRGYFWIGTDNGLCRYDGKYFKTYYHPKQRGKSFSYLQEDNKHRIWALNFAGQIFYIENDSMKLFEPFEKIYKSGFPRFCIDNKGLLWIFSTDNPPYYYSFETQKFNTVKGLNKGFVMSMYADKKGNVIVVSDSIYLVRNEKLVKSFGFFSPVTYSKFDDNFYTLANTGNYNVVKILHPDKGFLPLNSSALKANMSRITDFVSFSEKNRWLLTYDGAYHIEADSKHSKMLNHILKGNVVSWLTNDNEGNYWLSTLKNGIFVIPSDKVWLLNKENSALKNNRVVKITEHIDGNLYLGGGNGLVTVFNTDKKQIVSSIEISSENKDVDALAIDKKNNLLYIQANSTLVYNTTKKSVIKKFTGFSSIKDFSFDSYGNFLVVTNYQSFFVLGNANNKKSPYCNQYKFKQLNKVNAAIPDKYFGASLRIQRATAAQIREVDTTLWISYVDGLYYYKNGKEQALKNSKGDHIYATDLSLSQDGTLWVATVQQGIYAIKDTSIVLNLTTQNGLKSNFIRCLKSNNYMVWCGTDKGVQGYEINSQKLFQFMREDGLVTNDVMDIYIKNKTVYLATSKGFQWFDKDGLTANTISPPIYITQFLVNDVFFKNAENYTFGYNQNNIAISYNAIALTSRGNMQYAYRMIGVDTNWTIIPSSENKARFNALPPGNYTFEVKGINEDGISSIQPATVRFTISTPYWQKWWFVTLVVLVAFSLVSAGFIFRIKLLSKRSKLEREKSKLEVALRSSQLAALKVQMNPHFIFNALNSIQEYILTNEKKLANSYLGKFSDLMRLYLDMSNQTSITLAEEIKAMELYLELEAMRFEENFNYTLMVSPQLKTDEIKIPAMIIQPYIENAIKHGLLHKRNSRKLAVSFAPGLNSDVLICKVTDNGIGRKQSQELNIIRNRTYTSFATGATQKRLELLNAERKAQIAVVYDDLLHADGTPAGTTVTLNIPVQV